MKRPKRRPNQDTPQRYALRRKWYPCREHRGGVGGGDHDFMADELLYRSGSLGSAVVVPERVRAGSAGPALSITYTVGADGLEPGSQVSFVAKGILPLGGAFQVGDPSAPCWVRFTAPGSCRIEPFDPGDWKATFPIGFRLVAGALEPGQAVSLQVGPEQGFTWTRLAGRKEIKVCVRPRLRGPEYRLPEPLVITVEPRLPEELEVILPGTRLPGAAVQAIVTARDCFDNRVPVDGTAAVEGGGRACMREGLAVATVHGAAEPLRVTAILGPLASPPAALAGTSNPCVASGDLQLYFGDLHAHDLLSEAEGYGDEVYRWAREDRGFDFVAVSPQSHGWHDNETWTMTKYMNERHHEPGRFVTFLSYEWQHSGYGDKIVHYLGGDQPCLYADDPRYGTPGKLYRALRRSEAFVISHHPAYPLDSWVPGTDYAEVATDVERLIELWSMHGSSEGYRPGERPLKTLDPANFVMEALRRGLRLGFVAGSDTHKGRPGGSYEGQNPPNWGGMAAVWADGLSRGSLFEAFRSRRTCALTRARIVLRMTVNGAWMGEEIPFVEAAGIRIDVWAPRAIRSVELLKDARLLREFSPRGEECHLEHEERIEAPCFFHCRVTLEDGNLAVGSPVWVG